MLNANEQKTIKSTSFRLVKPGVFEKNELLHTMHANDVNVKPYMASICHADIRYFTGNRRKEALDEKLPMALFHEGLGIVSESFHPAFAKGDRVVIVPSIPGYALNNVPKKDCCRNCQNNGNPNYCLKGKFLGSGYDGISQSDLVINGNNLVQVPDEVDDSIALLAELCSVSLFAVKRAGKIQSVSGKKVAVFGDGPVGYLTAAVLHYIYGVAKENLIVFGAVREKLTQFECFATTELVNNVDFSTYVGIETVFECTGGKFSSSAINQAINCIDHEGKIVMLGVTEDLVPINTRDVLEKGIRLIGSSRSNVSEFSQLMEEFKKEDYQEVLKKLIPEQNVPIETTLDLERVMKQTIESSNQKKTYLSFEWG